MLRKIQFYIISLTFLFILILANQIPVCIGRGCELVDLRRLLFTYPPIILFCFIGVIFSVLFLLYFRYRILKGSKLPPETITEIQPIDYENLTFLATYIIPLVCFDLDFHLVENRNFIMLILVLVLIGWIYVKTNIFYTNPTLAILGFRVYRLSTNKRPNVVIITSSVLLLGDQIRSSRIDDNIYYSEKYGS